LVANQVGRKRILLRSTSVRRNIVLKGHESGECRFSGGRAAATGAGNQAGAYIPIPPANQAGQYVAIPPAATSTASTNGAYPTQSGPVQPVAPADWGTVDLTVPPN
jgi:hypothetical protein